MKKIFLTIAVFIVSAALLQAQNKTMYIMKEGAVINKLSIVPEDVDSIIFYKPTIITPGSIIETVLIPAGTFTMGSPNTEIGWNSEYTHLVSLSTFRMNKYEITNAQFIAFLNAKGIGLQRRDVTGAYPTEILFEYYSGLKQSGLSESPFRYSYTNSQWEVLPGYEYYPVTDVTWYGATEFATYVGGKLPTEAQWEYACRAGTTTPFSTGNFLTNLQANYNWAEPYNGGTNTITSSPYYPDPVGTYAPNAFGLYDMHGNVTEWCFDIWDFYKANSNTVQTDPTGPTIDYVPGHYRIVRGGSFTQSASVCRSAKRLIQQPFQSNLNRGFRVVFAP
jgi:formylglycine-generating enzyme required for sulfatase activity